MSSNESPNVLSMNPDALKGVGEYFFEPPERIWSILTFILGAMLFTMWTLRSGIDLWVSIPIILIYVIISAVSTRYDMKRLRFEQSTEKIVLHFTRSGVSWKYLFYAILGSAIPFLLPWFVAIDAFPEVTSIANTMMIIAMVVYILMVPVLPALASIEKLPMLKTKLTSTYDIPTDEITEFSVYVNPLDGYWYKNRNDENMRECIQRVAIEFSKERLDVDSFQV